ncbi:transposase [Candidatus Poribacteria bacterium]|nr:transposase [Candidatus Poribacteria bacterium]
MSPQHQRYVNTVCDHLIRWLKRKSRRISPEWVAAAFVLLFLDLEPARAILTPLDSPNPRGRRPYDPITMLRALLLMVLLKVETFSKWADQLKHHPRLARIAGFSPGNVPVAGTFYLFVDRLEDGPYQKPCEHRVKPSRWRKGRHRRNLKNEKQQRQHDATQNAAAHDSQSRALKDPLIAAHPQPRPRDLMQRLEDVLIPCAIIPSAQRGLLGNLSQLTVAGDGSALPSGANGNGKPTGDCRQQGIFPCDHSRTYTDPDADWGYDSYRACYYFGHTFYQHVVSTQGHDLPLHVGIGPASETDLTRSLKSLDRLRKALREHDLPWQIRHGVYDAGHDGMGSYEYLDSGGITPIIAINPRAKEAPAPCGTAERVNAEGIPICPAGVVMRRHTVSHKPHRITYNGPVKRPTHRNGEHLWLAHTNECPHGVLCQPDTKMGPIVTINTDDDPRLYPPIPRTSDRFEQLMNQRSGCERSNSIKKQTYHLGHRVCRSATHFLVRLSLVSIVEHAKAWVAEQMEQVKGDPLRLIEAIRHGMGHPLPEVAAA